MLTPREPHPCDVETVPRARRNISGGGPALARSPGEEWVSCDCASAAFRHRGPDCLVSCQVPVRVWSYTRNRWKVASPLAETSPDRAPSIEEMISWPDRVMVNPS